MKDYMIEIEELRKQNRLLQKSKQQIKKQVATEIIQWFMSHQSFTEKDIGELAEKYGCEVTYVGY